MTYEEIFKTITAVLASIGGAGVIIIGISSWLGKVWANRILEKDRFKYSSLLEELRIGYSRDLEERRSELEKSKTLFNRYSEHQFNLYNDLFRSLYDLKIAADNLWEVADFTRLRDFSIQLNSTINTIEKSILLIEDNHYEQLSKLLEEFSKFKVGKIELIYLRNMTVNNNQINNHDIQRVINNNSILKDRYSRLIKEIGGLFKKQIKLGS